MKLLDPVLTDLTPRHLEIFWRYQVVRTAVDFGAECAKWNRRAGRGDVIGFVANQSRD
jgi:hypothetical protein